MMRFSQRIGKSPIKTILQIESIDIDLKNILWNTILEDFFGKLDDHNSGYQETARGNVCRIVWKSFYKEPVDLIPRYGDTNNVYTEGFIKFVRERFYKSEWFDVYDFIEFLSGLAVKLRNTSFTTKCNVALKVELAGYRIVDEKIVQITSEEEILEIEQAIDGSGPLESVNVHIRTALNMLADKKNPDYRNSIKESISAVESLCIIITGDKSATLGKALIEIEKKYSIHGALKIAFSAIYGYTSDANGIRHALVDADTKLEFEDAKFMLVACSAFVNYLRSKMKI